MDRLEPVQHMEKVDTDTTLVFRKLQIGDVTPIMRWVNDPEITFYFANCKKEVTYEEERRYVLNLMDSKEDVIYSITTQTGEYVGQVSINKIDWTAKTGRMFLVIIKKFQNRGYAIPIIKSLQKLAFRTLKLNKLWLIVRYDNEKARHIYKRCGFETEGVLREEYYVNDQYHDMVRMSILKKDFTHWWK